MAKEVKIYHRKDGRWGLYYRSLGKSFFMSRKSEADIKALAKEVARGIKDYGEMWVALPAHTKAQLIELQERSTRAGYTLSEACSFFEANRQSISGSTVGELVTQFVETRKAMNVRPEYLRIITHTLEQFSAGREQTPIAHVTTAEIRAWVKKASDENGWGIYRQRGVITDLRTFFNWCVGDKHLKASPAASIKRPSVDYEQATILAPDQARRLMSICRQKYPKMLPGLAVCLFAGLRPKEASRMAWDDIDIDQGYIFVGGKQSKGRNCRLVEMADNLRAWLRLENNPKGKLFPKGADKLMLRLRKEFGGVGRDALRHSFVSYLLATNNSVEKTCLQAGNTEAVMMKHYRRPVRGEVAKEFWAILPE